MPNYLNSDFDINNDRLVEVFDELPFWAAPFGLKLLDKIQYRKNITALDVGFGAGFPLTELAMRLGSSCKVYGIDPWEAAIRRAEKKIAFYDIDNVELIKGVAENIPLHDNSLDLITSNNGLNNVADIDKALGECSRVMKQGGQLIQTMNLNSSMMEFYEIMESALKEKQLYSEIEKMNQQINKKRKPLDEVKQLLSKNGFSVEVIDRDEFSYKFSDGTALLNHYFMRLAFMDGWKSIVPVQRQEAVFEQVERLMNEKAEKYGCFKLAIPFVLIDCKKN